MVPSIAENLSGKIKFEVLRVQNLMKFNKTNFPVEINCWIRVCLQPTRLIGYSASSHIKRALME